MPMKRSKPNEPEFRFVPDEELSSVDLARFLRGLGSLYRDPKWGNPALGKALHQLARDLINRRNLPPTTQKLRRDKPSPPSRDRSSFNTFSANEIRRFLADLTKSKLELIELASIRFGIPRSKLMRLRTEEVRDRIHAALLNEDSLHIISEEAQRGGAKRSS